MGIGEIKALAGVMLGALIPKKAKTGYPKAVIMTAAQNAACVVAEVRHSG